MLSQLRPIGPALLTTVSKLHIAYGACSDFCWDGRNPAKFMLPRENFNDLHLSLEFVYEGMTTKVRMSYGGD